MTLPSYVGRFKVRNEIATSGFAVVLRAWDEELACFVALKILLRGHAEDEDIQFRFLEEARLLRRIRSPYVVTVHDVGRLNDGRPYFVMDYADRGTLASRLEAHAGTEETNRRSVMTLVDAVADGLSAIHEAGIVHRDIKPANILYQLAHRGSVEPDPAAVDSMEPPSALVGIDERILISDLGIAKDLLKRTAAATMVGGTPLFQAPEQGDPTAEITPAADVYATTAMLWLVLTGKQPPAANLVSKRLIGLPVVWREVMAQGMAIDPEARFATIESWRTAVHEALTNEAAQTQVDLPTEIAAVEAQCPYKGLASYQKEDARFFFGREALIDEIIQRFKFSRFLVVGGPSGSGKSSVVQAGLIPALKAGALPGSENWRLIVFTPGRDPIAELYYQVTRHSQPGDCPVALENVIEHPTLARHLYSKKCSEEHLMLCIDQFEELFTLAPAAQQTKFISALSAMADPGDSRVRIVIAVRADFYAACAQIPWLAERISNNQVLVGPMTAVELRRAIVEPTRTMGLHLDRGLVDAIIDEAGNEKGSLPLVAHALVETWNRREGATLTLDGFRTAGGVTGAISQTADAIYKDRFNEIEREATQRLFLRLVTPGEGVPDTRRVLARSEIQHDSNPEVMQRVVECLTEARLLTVDTASVQIAHEALLRTWPRLRAWIEASRDELRMRQRISRAATEWHTENRDPDLLYRGTPLLSALEWAHQNPDQLGQIERNFLDAAAEIKAKAEANSAEKERRARRVRGVIIAVLSTLALGATVASLVAFLAMRDARLNEERAELATAEAHERFASALGVGAHGMVNSDPLLSLVLAAEAVARAETQPPPYDARATMLAARKVLTQGGPFLVGSPVAAGDALSIALSPDGAMLASAQRDGAIDLIDTATRQRISSSLRGHVGGVREVKFSPDGQWLASAGADGTLRLWTVRDGLGGGGRIIGETGDVMMGICFSPDGSTVATGNGDGTIQMWNVVQGAPVGKPLIDLALGFNVVEFSHDGRGLIASTHDGTIFGWAIPSRMPLFEPLTGVHTSHLLKLAFSPAGDRFATASTDGTSMVLEFPSGRIIGPAFGPQDQISSVVFRPDGRILIGANADGAVRLWDAQRQVPIGTTPPGHSQAIVDIDLSEDGRLLATLGQDQVIRLWSFDSTHSLSSQLQVAGQKAKGLAISSDGKHLATGDDAGVVQVWELNTHKELIALQGHEHQVWALAFSPNRRLLASGDRSGQIRIWNLENGALQQTIDAQDGAIWSLTYGKDGKKLMSASEEHIRFWEAETGTLLTTFKNDGARNTRAVQSPDGTLLAVSSTDGTVKVWDIENATVVREIKVDDDVLWCLAFSPSSQHLAVGSSDEVVSVWDLADGKQRAAFTGHRGGVTDVAYLSDGVTLVVVDRSGMLHWWDALTGRRLSEAWPAHDAASWRLAVHPDGVRFATTGDDGKIKIWDELSVDRACEIGQRALDSIRIRQYLGQNEHSVACK